jgi:hypothetical protein
MILEYDEPQNAGEMNYLFSLICKNYVEGRLSYQRINDCIGALEGAKMEFYRRVAVPYEAMKIAENGDVYEKARN